MSSIERTSSPDAVLRSVVDDELRETIADAGIGTWHMQVPGRMLDVSRTGLDLLGRPSPPPGTWSDLLALVHPEDREHVSQALEVSLESGRVRVALGPLIPQLTGRSILLAPALDRDERVRWICVPIDIPARYLPHECREG